MRQVVPVIPKIQKYYARSQFTRFLHSDSLSRKGEQHRCLA